MLSGLITILPVLFGLMLIAAAVWEFMTWKSKFSDWSYGGATSMGAIKKHGDVGPRLAYEFNVDGTTYEGISSYMKDILPPKGERIDIYYDPQNPSRSEWYSDGMHKFFMVFSALIGVLVLWLAF